MVNLQRQLIQASLYPSAFIKMFPKSVLTSPPLFLLLWGLPNKPLESPVLFLASAFGRNKPCCVAALKSFGTECVVLSEVKVCGRVKLSVSGWITYSTNTRVVREKFSREGMQTKSVDAYYARGYVLIRCRTCWYVNTDREARWHRREGRSRAFKHNCLHC